MLLACAWLVWWLHTIFCLLATQQEVSVSCVHLPVEGTDAQPVEQGRWNNRVFRWYASYRQHVAAPFSILPS